MTLFLFVCGLLIGWLLGKGVPYASNDAYSRRIPQCPVCGCNNFVDDVQEVDVEGYTDRRERRRFICGFGTDFDGTRLTTCERSIIHVYHAA